MLKAPSPPTKALSLRLTFCLSTLLLVLWFPTTALAQIKQPGAHVNYSVELEPHGVILWDGPGSEEGIGLGFRASIPLFHNGPIPKINNNMAIGFGFDWVYYDLPCSRAYYNNGVVVIGGDCSATDFWMPVVAQWNFYLTPAIAVFGEPGLAVRHRRISLGDCRTPNGTIINCDDSDTDFLNPFFAAGGKFFVSRSISVTVRLGFPAISVGASFYL